MVHRLYLILRHRLKIRQKPPTERETIPEVVNRCLNARVYSRTIGITNYITYIHITTPTKTANSKRVRFSFVHPVAQ